jgi:hypothetical protein
MRRVALASALVVAGIATSTTSAQARPVDQFRSDERVNEVIEGYCPGETVHLVARQLAVGVGRIAGPDRALRYTVRVRGRATITNIATGRAFAVAWNFIDQDMRVTDNGDGTLSILGHSPGSERVRGPDGKLVDVKAGLTRWIVLLDHGGTPTDGSDDTFLGIEFLSGPRYEEFCADFSALTG